MNDNLKGAPQNENVEQNKTNAGIIAKEPKNSNKNSNETFVNKAKNLSVNELDNLVKTKTEQFDEDITWLDFGECKKFLVKGSVNVISADSGVGKTWFSLILALGFLKYEKVTKVYHFNLDGSVRIYKARKLLDKIQKYLKFDKWIHIDYDGLMKQNIYDTKQLLEIYAEKPKEELDGSFMILDSLGNFTGDTNDSKAIIDFFKTLRILANNGVTIIINTHNKKNEAIFSGSGAIKYYADTLYSFKREIDKDDKNLWHIPLEIQKSRNDETSQAFDLNLVDISLTPIEYKEVASSQTREEIKNKILNALKNEPNGLNKSKLLTQIGKTIDDKTAHSVIKEFENKLWKIKKQGRANIVILINNSIW